MDAAGAGNQRPASDSALYDRTDPLTRTDLWAWREAEERLARSTEPQPPAQRGDSDFASIVEDVVAMLDRRLGEPTTARSLDATQGEL
jgi:hypothetical protein